MNPSSIGGSKLTVAAECIATSMPAGISGWPRLKSPSITSTRSSSIAIMPVSPTRSRSVSNAGLRNRYSTRSRLVVAGLAAHQQDHAGLGEVGQQAFEDDLREEAGHPGEQHRLAREGFDDRGRRGWAGLALYHAADYAVSTGR